MTLKQAFGAAFALAIAIGPIAAQETSKFDTGMIPSPHILLPDGDVAAEIVLISDAGGWTAADDKTAKALADKGALVIGIDLPSYLASLAKDDGACVYMVSDIESLSQQTQRSAGNNSYQTPIVAGIGAGGALSLAIAAQTPAATISQTLAIDPDPGIALKKQLCTPAAKQAAGNGMIYGLTGGPLPDPITIAFTEAASKDARDHANVLHASHPGIDVHDTADDARTALSTGLGELIDVLGDAEDPLGLPIDVLETTPTRDTMAVIYSGDGGWRDLDKQIGGLLQKQGVPVVGVDSLRYFWSERGARQTADDLARIIDVYRKRWKVNHVMLVGYSFGADILPATYNLLSKDDKSRVPQISLMALSHQVDYQVSVLGWLGAPGAGTGGDPVDDLKSIDPALVQCVYGTEDDGDACPDLKGSGAEVIALDGGHHFDEDYEALAARLLDGLQRRMAK